MRVSIITVVYNNESTIGDSILSVQQQNYGNIEHIIVDGYSTDNTMEIINSKIDNKAIVISESDDGMYDAMNKGIKIASGDIIGILNADDIFYDENVISKIAKKFATNNIEALYGDVVFVKQNNTEEILRYYSGKKFKPYKFAYGFMPPHPSFYAKKEVFEKHGYYKTNYKIAADYEILIRFLAIKKIKTAYLNLPMVKMRMGGVSNKDLKSVHTLNTEIVRACRENNIKTHILIIYMKYFIKIFEFILHRFRNK